MDLLFIACTALLMGVVLVALGLSFIDFGLSSVDFNGDYGQTSGKYYQNPLHRLGSKYFHYRPKGSVILSEKQWANIERNMGIKLNEAKTVGKSIGYKIAIVEVQDKIREEKAKTAPSSPYLVLGVKPTTSLAKIEERYKHLLQIYNPKFFNHLDKSFVELSEIRTAQIVRAWNQINLGVKPKSVSGGNF